MMLDTPTLLMANTVVFAVLAISLGLVVQRQQPEGLHLWATGLALQSAAFLLLSMRDRIPDWASITLANGMRVAAFALYVESVAQFRRLRPNRWLIWSPVPLAIVLFALYIDDMKVRALTGALLPAFEVAMLVRLLVAGGLKAEGRGRHFMIAGALMLTVMLLGRSVSAVTGLAPVTTSIMESNPIQSMTLFVVLTAMVLMTFGLVIMAKERADEHNRALAMHDELTGMNNRRYIQQTLSQHMAQAKRFQRPLAVLMMDIDHFKRVNDTYGHMAGDKVLHDLAQCIQERLRAQDVGGRWGGEEFIAVLPDTDVTGATALAEQLRQAVERSRFTTPEGAHVPLTISIGVHALRTGYEDERDDMVGQADRALYRAKERGRNRVEVL